MKKLMIIAIFLLGLFFMFRDEQMIRIRVLANSNSEYDQKIKREVVDIVKKEFGKILKNTTNIEEARGMINDNLDKISTEVDKYLIDNKVNYGFNVNFGLNYFPTKKYNNKEYKEGYYESVLVTLGKGEGENWWCILFPTVCLSEDNTKYESFLGNLLSKILK